MTIICARCGTASDTRRDHLPWCQVCGIYLFHDEHTDEWISGAELAYRQPTYQRRAASAATRDAALAAQPAVQELLPPGWRAHLGEASHGGCFTLDLYPPSAVFDGYPYLVPPIEGRLWRVRVYDRGAAVCQALLAPHRSEVATFPDATVAARAGIAAVLDDGPRPPAA
jgi:hypothetical protein